MSAASSAPRLPAPRTARPPPRSSSSRARSAARRCSRAGGTPARSRPSKDRRPAEASARLSTPSAARDGTRRTSSAVGRPRSRRRRRPGRAAVSIVSGASCWYLALNVRSRRNRSTAFRFATAINHAPGFRGSPSRGHCTIASVSASCARSSARLTSSTWRARPATRRGNSMRNTVSIASRCRCVGGRSSPVTARDSTRVTPDRTPAAPGLRPRRAPRGTASTTRPPRRGRGTPSTPIPR